MNKCPVNRLDTAVAESAFSVFNGKNIEQPPPAVLS
jgi:hypothetical protein